ncbi:hypothetical protein CANINC_002098 [Pichia inconspicua]|uniref:E3 ubiquitin protein ligase n=1 Tax=Pichia inconspicua TaxID=52247 RepID=A0A4V4NFS1_9ASCO|nr:hypothetical protein CANINC_002098 [[Candida] inconspicua]
MDTNKRPIDEQGSSCLSVSAAPRKLRKLNQRIAKILTIERSEAPLESLSTTEEPLAQEDVVYFQKEAIYRLLQLQCRKNALLTSTLDSLHSRYSRVVLCNSILVQWWFQIVDNLKSLFQIDEVSISSLNTDLLISLVAVENSSNDNDDTFVSEVKENLKSLQNGLSTILTSLIGKSPQTPTTEQLLALQNEISNVKVLRATLNDENNSLRDELAKTRMKLEDMQRRWARESSRSVQRVRSVEAPQTDTEVVTPVVNAPITRESSENVEVVDKSKLEDLEVQLAELRGQNDSLILQVEEKAKRVTELERNCTIIKNNVNDESNKYKDVVNEVEKLRSQIDELVGEKRKLESELFEIESKVTKNQALLESKVRSEIESNQTYVEKLEKDLTRIRNDRDSLNSKIAILRSEKGKSNALDDYKLLTTTLETRVRELEEIEQKLLNNEGTEEREKILVNELKQVEAAFRDVREIAGRKLISAHEQEQQIAKLSAEKAKAEEKYFQAMRAKDALSSQNKVLQASVVKQMELIEVLRKKETELIEKLNIEEKLFNLMSKIERDHVIELGKIQKKLNSVEKELVVVKGREKDIHGELSKKEHEFNLIEREKLNLERDISGLRKSMKQLKDILNTYRNGGNIEKIDNDAEVQEALLSMTKCSLCNKNFKNVALKTCGHCFCKDCVDDRLAARMRKCPNCNSQFSQYDVLLIHL